MTLQSKRPESIAYSSAKCCEFISLTSYQNVLATSVDGSYYTERHISQSPIVCQQEERGTNLFLVCACVPVCVCVCVCVCVSVKALSISHSHDCLSQPHKELSATVW